MGIFVLFCLSVAFIYYVIKSSKNKANNQHQNNSESYYNPQNNNLPKNSTNHTNSFEPRSISTPVKLTNKKIDVTTKKYINEGIKEFVAIDLETTGFDSSNDKILEIAAIKYVNGVETDKFCTLINPEVKISSRITKINGITDSMVANKPYIENVLTSLKQFIGDSTLVAHNATFDLKFLKYNFENNDIEFNNPYIDTLTLSRKLYETENHKLGTIAQYLGIMQNNAHRAEDDAKVTAQILIKIIENIKELHTKALAVIDN